MSHINWKWGGGIRIQNYFIRTSAMSSTVINLFVAMYCKLFHHIIFHFLLYMVIGNVVSLSSITSVFIKLLTALNVVPMFLVPIFSVCFRFWTYILALGDSSILLSLLNITVTYFIFHYPLADVHYFQFCRFVWYFV